MKEYVIADNQDISKAGMMFLLSRQKEVSLILEADNKAELIAALRLHPTAVIILDYTLFDITGAEELMVVQQRFKETDWLLFSDELSMSFLRQVLFSSRAFSVVMKEGSKEGRYSQKPKLLPGISPMNREIRSRRRQWPSVPA